MWQNKKRLVHFPMNNYTFLHFPIIDSIFLYYYQLKVQVQVREDNLDVFRLGPTHLCPAVLVACPFSHILATSDNNTTGIVSTK